MNVRAAHFAVKRFKELQQELGPIIASMGFQILQCKVRQRGDAPDQDTGWNFIEIGMSDDYEAFWGKLIEQRDGQFKEVLVVVDTDSIDSIEFEVYDEDLNADKAQPVAP